MTALFQDHRRERELLSRFLLHPEDQVHISRITPAIFDHETNRQLFACLRQMQAKGCTITANTVTDWLGLNSNSIGDGQVQGLAHLLSREWLEADGEPLVFTEGRWVAAEPDPPEQMARRAAVQANEHIPYLVEIMGKRRISQVSRRMSEMLSTNTLENIITYVDREIGAFEQGYELRGMGDITASVRKRIVEARESGARIIKTGFTQVDEAIGLMPSTHCLIIGKSGEGKSALANQLVTNICLKNDNISVLYFSMEIHEEKLIENFIANLSDTTKNRLRGKGTVPITPIEMDAIDEQIALINTFDMEIHYGSKDAREASSIIDVFAATRRHRQIVIVTDHHLYIRDTTGSMQDAINAFSKMYIGKKEQYKALTFLLCQFHLKHTESENNRGEQIPPDAKWIMYPGTLFMDADTTCAIWRRNRHDAYETESEVMELYWQKNREGQPDICTPLVFTPKYGQFRDVMQRTYDQNKSLMAEHVDGADANGELSGGGNPANFTHVNGKPASGGQFPVIDF